jgi:hypothetical protein
MLQTVTPEIETANVAYFQRKIQLSGFCAYRMARRPDEWNYIVIPLDARDFAGI